MSGWARHGQAVGIMRFFAGLGAGAVLIGGYHTVFSELHSIASAEATGYPEIETGLTWTSQAWDALPWIFVLLSVFGLVALSVYQRRAVR